MNSRRKFLTQLLAAGISFPALNLLAACGAPAPASPPTAAPPPAPTAAPPAAAKPTTSAAAATTVPSAAAKPTTAAPVATSSASTLPLGNARFSKKYQGVTLNALMADRPTTNVLKDKYLKTFADMTGINVNFDVPPYDPMHQKAMLDLSGSSAAYDVIMMDVPWLAEFVNTKSLMPLDELVAKEDPTFTSDFIPRVLEAMGRAADGHLYGIVNVGTTFEIAYRQDLFQQEAANFKAATGNELKPAETWDDVIAQTKFFTKKYNPNSPTDYGCAMNGQPGNPSLNLWQPILWGIGGREINDKYEATINDEKGVRSFQIIAELAKNAEENIGAVAWDEMNKLFLAGKAALHWGPTEFSTNNEAPDSPIKGKTAYAWIPGHAPQIGGWAMVINKNTKNPEAAWDFVRWQTGPEFAKELTLAGGQSPRFSVMTDPELTKVFPFFPITLEEYKVIQNRLSVSPTAPGLIPEAQYELEVGTQVSSVVTGGKTPQQAADDSAKFINKLMKDFGYQK